MRSHNLRNASREIMTSNNNHRKKSQTMKILYVPVVLL